MKESSQTAESWASHSQFLVFDAVSPYDPEMVAHFNGANDQNYSVRRREVSIALLPDADGDAPTKVTLTTHAKQPGEPTAPDGSPVAVTGEVGLECPGGSIGVRGILEDTHPPWIAVDISAQNVRVRFFGWVVGGRNVFVVQVWPAA
jgi:hypothetical protein